MFEILLLKLEHFFWLSIKSVNIKLINSSHSATFTQTDVLIKGYSVLWSNSNLNVIKKRRHLTSFLASKEYILSGLFQNCFSVEKHAQGNDLIDE